jgi:DNA-directed RNA polymerase specialized sigma24 family protein
MVPESSHAAVWITRTRVVDVQLAPLAQLQGSLGTAEQNASAADPLTGMQVRRALRALDHPKRLVLVLRWYLDLPIEEIAATTGSSVHAVESRLRRGTEELRRRLAMEESRSG